MRSLIILIFCSCCICASAQNNSKIADKTKNMKRYDGYFPFWWDAANGKIWMLVDKLDKEFLYVNSLPAGLGSNDIGLDRGLIGGSRIVRFERSGPRVLLVQPNYRYRAVTSEAMERRSVEQSFAQSVLWGFDAAAEDAGHVLV